MVVMVSQLVLVLDAGGGDVVLWLDGSSCSVVFELVSVVLDDEIGVGELVGCANFPLNTLETGLVVLVVQSDESGEGCSDRVTSLNLPEEVITGGAEEDVGDG